MKTRQAKEIQTKLVTLVYGATFSGKSTLCLGCANLVRNDGKPFRVAVVDAEGGGVDDVIESLLDEGVNGDNIQVFYTQSLMEVSQILSKIKNHDMFYEFDEDGIETDVVMKDADGEDFFPDAIVIDGTSILKLTSEQGLLELSKKRNTIKANKDGLIGDERFVKIQGADLEFKDYKKLNYNGQNLVLDLMACGIHVFLTARETVEKVQVKDKNGDVTSVATGKKVYDSFKGMDYNCKTILRMFQDKETGMICAEVIKDRTKAHKAGDIIEDPTILDWQSVIDKNANKPEFVLKNDLDKAVEAEQKMYEEEAMRTIGESVTGKTTVPQQTESTDSVDIDSLRKEVMAKKNALPATQKAKLKTALEEKGLPTAFKSVTDAKVLQSVLDLIASM